MKRFTKSSSAGPRGDEKHHRIYQAIGRKIRRERVRRGLTQQELADAICLTRPSVANIESGRQCFLFHTIFEIAAKLNVKPADLLSAPRRPSTNSLREVVNDYDGVGHEWIRETLGAEWTRR